MSKEAMKLALEALKQIDEAMPFPVAKLAQAALREALAEQPSQQEPAFWTRKQWGMDREFCERPFTTDWEPLYTSPPTLSLAQRKPLTDEEIKELYGDDDNFRMTEKYVVAFARAIEAAHGIKENRNDPETRSPATG